MNPIRAVFEQPPALDLKKLDSLAAAPEPRRRYLIAITPRSGSSYLCSALKNTKRLGWPQEALGQDGVTLRLAKNVPANTPEEYLHHFLRLSKTRNNIAGIKASWFQFEHFIEAMDDRSYWNGFKYIYLTRRDLCAQAVSLYKAVSSNVFHSIAVPSDEALAKLAALEYDYEQIKFWYDHIVTQEQGWKDHFARQRIFPFCISYEEIEQDIIQVIRRIAEYVGVNPNSINMNGPVSNFKKIRNQQSEEWALRFSNELASNVNRQPAT